MNDHEIYLQCKKCDFNTTSHDELKTHRKVQHPAVRYLCEFCEFCEFKTVHWNQLDKHTRNSHSEDFACDKCIFRAANIGDLTNYKHTKHATVFPCDFCTYKAFSKQDLNRHIRVMHTDKQPTILFNRTRLQRTHSEKDISDNRQYHGVKDSA